MSYIKTKKEVLINSRKGTKSIIAFRNIVFKNIANEPIIRFSAEICTVSSIYIEDSAGNEMEQEIFETIELVKRTFSNEIYTEINFTDPRDILEKVKGFIAGNSKEFFELKLEDLEIIN